MTPRTVYQRWKLKLYPYGWHQTQPPQEGSNRNLAMQGFLALWELCQLPSVTENCATNLMQPILHNDYMCSPNT